MGIGSRLVPRAPRRAVGQTRRPLVGIAAPAPEPSIPQLSEASVADEAPPLEAESGLRGIADLRAAVLMVAAGAASSMTLCGFPDGHELLRVGRDLAVDGIVVEPVIRTGGGGFDIRVRCLPPAEA